MGGNKFSGIFNVLKADIIAGKYVGGAALPSAPALMRRFGVASSSKPFAQSRERLWR